MKWARIIANVGFHRWDTGCYDNTSRAVTVVEHAHAALMLVSHCDACTVINVLLLVMLAEYSYCLQWPMEHLNTTLCAMAWGHNKARVLRVAIFIQTGSRWSDLSASSWFPSCFNPILHLPAYQPEMKWSLIDLWAAYQQNYIHA